MWLAFHVTDRCQLRCVHCFRDPDHRPIDVSPALVDSVLDQAKKHYGMDHVGFTGGEPLLHPRFREILGAVARHGFTWHLVTNAELIDRLFRYLHDDCRLRDLLEGVSLSVEGSSEKLHDAIRGKGNFRSVMKAATLCRVHGIPIRLQTTVNALNQHDMEAVALSASELGAAHLSFGMTFPCGASRDRELFLSAGQLRAVHDRITRLSQTLTMPTTFAEGFHRPRRFHVCDALRNEILHVNHHGHLTLCCNLSGLPGDERDVVADLSRVPLVDAHQRLLELIHEAHTHRLSEIRTGLPIDAWDHFPCNTCMRLFGKPYWTEQGSAGPRALERNRGPVQLGVRLQGGSEDA